MIQTIVAEEDAMNKRIVSNLSMIKIKMEA